MRILFRISLITILFAIAYSCATPSSPTGGPRDTQGPEVIRTEPQTGTVNFTGDQIILHFSEYVERGSLSQALVIEPELGLDYSLDWGRKSVAVEFNRELPDSTTLIVTVGTDFSDLNGNSLASPYKVAVSTGPEIDEGKLIGRIRNAKTGQGNEGHKVLLYRSPADLTQPASYIGETDTSGMVNFTYLRQGQYKAFWVDDRNRNKVWEPERERAQPFYKEFVTLEKAGTDTLGTLYIANSDTSKPVLQGVGLFSSQRMRLRFSENISLTDSTQLQIQDSTGTDFASADPLYSVPNEEYILFAQSSEPLSPEKSFTLRVQNIADQSGNLQAMSTQSFTGSAQEDTTQQRIIGSSVGAGIFPTDTIRIAYAKPITQASTRDSLKVVEGDSIRSPWPNLEIEQNKLRILPDSVWKRGVDYEFRIWEPAIQRYQTITPTIWHETDVGALSITFTDTTAAAAGRTTQLLLKTDEGNVVADTSFTQQIGIEGLAPINHQLILYQDVNGNGQWDFGQVSPYESPEPYYVQNEIPIQSGFTSDLAVSFQD